MNKKYKDDAERKAAKRLRDKAYYEAHRAEKYARKLEKKAANPDAFLSAHRRYNNAYAARRREEFRKLRELAANLGVKV